MVGEMRLIEYSGQFEKFDRFGVMLSSANLPTIRQSEDAAIVSGRLPQLLGFIEQSRGIRSMRGRISSPIARNHYGTYRMWGNCGGASALSSAAMRRSRSV